MDLKVALIGKSFGWLRILEQIGINFDQIGDVSANSLLKYPAVILSETANGDHIDKVRNYVKTGGSLLCSTLAFYQDNSVKNLKEKYVKFLIPDNYGYFNVGEFIDIGGNIIYSDNAEYLKSNHHEYTLTEMNHGDGKVILLPFDAGYLYEDSNHTNKSFFSFKNRLPHERVLKVSRGPIRRLVNNALEYLFHSQNLLYCHKWFFPLGKKNVFLFRVDTDFGTLQNVTELYKLASEHNVPITWFIDVKSQKDNLYFYTQMQNQEIALHCYEHKDFKKINELKLDLETAIEYLSKYNIFSKGYAVVFGKWNKEIAGLIKDCKFFYSSEFSFDYDNLPSFDEYENLQIPIHPICIGSLKRQGHSSSDMIRYFEMVIQKKISIQDPLIFYHHPNDSHIDVVHYIFNKIKTLQIDIHSFLNFAKWWKSRNKVNYSAKVEGNLLDVHINDSSNCFLRITNKENQEAFINSSGIYIVGQLNWQRKPIPAELPGNYKKIYKFNIWKIINKIEDMI